MKNIKKYIIFILVSFISYCCGNGEESDLWKKVGEINLDGTDLIITVPKLGSFNGEWIRFYMSSINRKQEIRFGTARFRNNTI